jgi:signal peptidase I
MTLRKWFFIVALCSAVVGCGGPYSSGDRVLVSKLDAQFMRPKRYEVVVFKYPVRPIEDNTPKNYIKRLLGLPGEIIAIFFGRVYHRVPEEGAPPFFDDLKDGKTHPNDLWKAEHMHVVDEHGRNAETNVIDEHGKMMRKWFDEGKFEIMRKPPHVALALRRLVYDNDFQAKDLKGKLDRWSPKARSAWKPDKETGFTFEGNNADQVDWLRYQHLLRPQGALAGGDDIKPSLITDTMAYNSFQLAGGGRGGQTPYWVGDLMIECHVEVVQPKGEFWLELSKGIHRFQARWDCESGQCTLFRVKDGKQEVLGSEPTNAKGPGTYLLRFANIDARLTVWVGRALPFGDGKDYDPPEVRGKNEKDLSDALLLARRGPTENDLQPASIGCKGARVNLSHITLWRDTYYSTSVRATEPDFQLNERADWSNPKRWDSIRKARFATLYVQPGHYFCLGDNSQASADSRQWGLVPERLMLGRALVVY